MSLSSKNVRRAALVGSLILVLGACGGDTAENSAAAPAPRESADPVEDPARDAAEKLANVPDATENAAQDASAAVENAAANAEGAVETVAVAAQEADGASAYAALTGDAAKGRRVYAKCMACHSVVEGQNRVGPSLYGMIGREAGSIEGFNYSDANANSGIVWTEEVMFAYLKNPQQYMPGTRMVFPGLPSEQDRADVIAYLKSVSE